MAILGLTSSKTFSDNGFLSQNNRRRIFHDYPNGAAPLTGLLSLMKEDATDNAQFGWFEKRYEPIQTELVASSDSPFSSNGLVGGEFNTPQTYAAEDVVYVKVDSTNGFQVQHTVWLVNLPVTSGIGQLKGVITGVTATHLKLTVTEDIDNVISTNDLTTGTPAGPVGAQALVIGSAAPEGNRSVGSGRLVLPVNPQNFTQIFRTPFSFTGTSLKLPANFDKTGIYKEKAKDNAVDHAVSMEHGFLFGSKSLSSVTNTQGETVPLRTTGGLTWFLEQWQAANGGEPQYRPNGAAVVSDSDENARIIQNVSGSMSVSEFNSYVERAFRVTNNKSFEKLVLCGSGAITTLNDMVRKQIVVNKNMPAEDTYGMNVTTIETPHGILHFKSHPLFTSNPALRYSAFIIDVGNLRYRPLNDRDTVLLTNRQHNDEDGRKDEWLTEAGLEVRFPESHMIIHNFKAVTNS